MIMGFLDKFLKNQLNSMDKSTQPEAKSKLPSFATCPQCGTVLDKVPTRKAKCPHCGKDIYVRSKQSLFDSPFLTESQADAVDAIKNFEFLGLSDKAFRDMQAQLTAKFGKQANVDDSLWGLYNSLLTKLAKSGEFMQLSIIYSQMAVFMTKRGKDSRQLQIESNKMMLRDYAKSGVTELKVVCNTEACETCKQLDSKKFKMTKDILNNPPLPPEGCMCDPWKGKPPLCACSYIAVTITSSFGGVYKVS